MSNTVKIKNKKKKKELKINYKLWAIVFAIFVAIIVGLSVWASFHWGVGMGTIGVRPVDPEDAMLGATDIAAIGETDIASEYATGDMQALTAEELEQMGISLDGVEGAEVVEEAVETEDAGEESGEEASEETKDEAAEETQEESK